MNLKEIKSNYKKKNRNNFEILQYLLYVNLPNLREQFQNCENSVNQEQLLKQKNLQKINDLYSHTIDNVENNLKDIMEVKKATLKDLHTYVKELSTISNELAELDEVINLFRKYLNEENQIDNGVKIFVAEAALFVARSDIDLVVERYSKK